MQKIILLIIGALLCFNATGVAQNLGTNSVNHNSITLNRYIDYISNGFSFKLGDTIHAGLCITHPEYLTSSNSQYRLKVNSFVRLIKGSWDHPSKHLWKSTSMGSPPSTTYRLCVGDPPSTLGRSVGTADASLPLLL